MNSAYSVTIKNGQSTATIPIEYERKRRRRLVLRVYPRTARVVFSVPLHTPEDYAADFLQKHLPWLEKQLQKVLPFLPPRHTYLSGDAFYYLGRALPLVCLPGAENRAQVVGGEIILRSKQPLPEEGCKALLEKMFAQLLPPLVAASLSRFWPLYAPFLDLAAPPQVKTRKMISRWGVCRPLSNEVCFSKRLVHLPRRLIDYVVVHELCHFRFFDHGPRFWRLVEKGAPDWRECRRELNRMDAYIDI